MHRRMAQPSLLAEMFDNQVLHFKREFNLRPLPE